MFQLLWLIPALPFFGFLILAVVGKRLPRALAATFGVGSVGISALLTIGIGIQFISSPPPNYIFIQDLWGWLDVGGFSPHIAFHLDALSMVFIFVITFVGFLIHLYSSEFMLDDEGYSRFFAYMNLFVGSMLTLVLADNLLLLYLGWEGVGLCSYLLIGFWYQDPANGYAARKAFVVTRVGDTAMAIGLFMLYTHFHTLNISIILEQAPVHWMVGSSIAVAVALLLLGGAVGKSAQLPLQTWLPDAMAGPTPVSALIHAATMVTAGVYLIARTHVLFELAPVAQLIVAIVGALTLLLAGFSAVTQYDIKRVLAYSTISQIGYMFLALGVGAWSAGVFHFMTHAFFKALLFLGAGVIILGLHHEHNMFKMGGLRKQLPVTFWTFLIASASLAALPLITAGFYSKDMILWFAFSSQQGSVLLWAAGLFGAFITAIYTFRMVFITFYGEAHQQVDRKPGIRLKIPLVVLAFLSLVGGFIEIPQALGNLPLFSDFLHSVLPEPKLIYDSIGMELFLEIDSAVAVLVGIYVAYQFFLKRKQLTERIGNIPVVQTLHQYWFAGWAFDWLYDHVFVFPLVWFSKINKNDFIDQVYSGIAAFSRFSNRVFSYTQSGNLRWYAAGLVFGALVTITIVIFL